MVFAHDTEVALAAAAALVNTEQDDGDELPDVAALDEFVRTWGWTGGAPARPRPNSPRCARSGRDCGRCGSCDEDDAVDLINELLREARALPQLVKHDEWDYHLHATSSDAPLADRMAVEAAMAFVDVIRQQEFSRLQTCAADDCDDVLVDLSKNHSRRFCSTSCANRTNVAAYRARQRRSP